LKRSQRSDRCCVDRLTKFSKLGKSFFIENQDFPSFENFVSLHLKIEVINLPKILGLVYPIPYLVRYL